ncbi:MAG: hypothetical protein JNL10_20115 [Verrucomicrobiales bacterium]|nr:hypothetical protein [Verrucomicrobiales bacterium]
MGTATAEHPIQEALPALQRAAVEGLPLVATALAGAYLVFSMSHLWVLPPATARWMSPLALGSSILYAAAAWRLRRHPVPPRRVHPLIFCGSLVMLANCAAHLGLTGELIQTTNFMAHILGWSCLLLDLRWQSAMLAVTWATWGGLAQDLGAPGTRVHFLFALLSSTALGVAILHLRRMAILRYEAQLKETRRAREAAEAADRVKALFLATMSHEVRTPMNGILATTDLLQQTPLNPRQRELTRVIDQSGRSLLDLLTNLLEYSRRDSTRLEVELREFSLESLLQEVVHENAAPRRDDPVELRVSLSPELPRRFHGDERHLRQVLSYVIGNAFKFTVAGSITVRASPCGPGRVRIEVKDTGIGIRPEDQARLFQPFEQADGSTTRRHGGVGLGLARSRQILEGLGGSIGLESARGSGTTVWMELPLAAAPDETRASETEGNPRSKTPASRVLIAAEADVNRRLAVRLVEKMGGVAGVADAPGDVLPSLERQPYNAVLLEEEWLQNDRTDLLRRIREAENAGRLALNGPLYIAVMTTIADGTPVVSWKSAGADGVLVRPFGLAALRSLWKTPRTTASPATPAVP